MKRKVDRTLLWTTALCLAPIALTLCVYGKLPEQVPTHWNFAGDVDGWSHKAFAGFGMPLIMAALNVVTHIALENDPKRKNIARAIVLIGKWSVPSISLLLIPMTMLAGLGFEVPISTLAPAIAGLLVTVMGNYMPKTRSSYTAGIRLPWTLHSEENWRRTHRVAGICLVTGGLSMTLSALAFPKYAWIGLAILLTLVAVTCAYSFFLHKRGI